MHDLTKLTKARIRLEAVLRYSEEALEEVNELLEEQSEENEKLDRHLEDTFKKETGMRVSHIGNTPPGYDSEGNYNPHDF